MIKFSSSNSKFRQTVLLYISTIVGLLLAVFSSTINTDILTLSDYGDLRYVMNMFSFISSFLLLGFFTSGSRLLAIKSDNLLRKRIKGGMIVLLLSTSVIMMLSMIVCSIIFYDNAGLSNLFLAAIFISYSPLLLNYINTTFQGENDIIGISIARIFPYLFYIISYYIITTFCEINSACIVLLLQNGTAVLVYVFLIYKSNPSFCNLKESLKILNNENKKYGFDVYIGSVIGVSSVYLIGIFLGHFEENNIDVGFYTLALTLSNPLALLPTIVGTVNFRNFANSKCISKKTFLYTILLSLLSLIVFLILIYPVVNILYPPEYSKVALYSSFLALGCTIHGFGDMLNRFLGAHGKGKALKKSAIACGSVLIIGGCILIFFWGIWGALFTKILSSFAYMLSLLFYYKNSIKNA